MDVGKMLISICVPCHNRTYDLKKTLPSWMDAARVSLPVEIVVLDYNSPDDLQEYAKSMGVLCPKYTGRNYYHMAHARNLSVLASHGEWVVEMNADSLMSSDFIIRIRELLKIFTGWITVHNNEGVMVMQKLDFIDAGGYDERFEFYSPEDKDLSARLARRGLSKVVFPSYCAPIIKTPDSEKIKNYRLPLSKKDMAKIMSPIYKDNIKNNILIANEGKEWGQWT